MGTKLETSTLCRFLQKLDNRSPSKPRMPGLGARVGSPHFVHRNPRAALHPSMLFLGLPSLLRLGRVAFWGSHPVWPMTTSAKTRRPGLPWYRQQKCYRSARPRAAQSFLFPSAACPCGIHSGARSRTTTRPIWKGLGGSCGLLAGNIMLSTSLLELRTGNGSWPSANLLPSGEIDCTPHFQSSPFDLRP
jgi:hypothetical protein